MELAKISLTILQGKKPKRCKNASLFCADSQLLMVVIRKKAATKKSFATMITVIRLHSMSYIELLEFVSKGLQHYITRL
jgi:hypothetical protein